MEELAKLLSKLDANKIAMLLGGFMIVTATGWYTTVEEPHLNFILTMVGVGSIIFLIGAALAVVKIQEEAKTKRLDDLMEYRERKRKELLAAGADPNRLSDTTVFRGEE